MAEGHAPIIRKCERGHFQRPFFHALVHGKFMHTTRVWGLESVGKESTGSVSQLAVGFLPTFFFRHARRRPNVIPVKAGRILDPAQMHLLLAHHVRLGGKKVAMKKDGA